MKSDFKIGISLFLTSLPVNSIELRKILFISLTFSLVQWPTGALISQITDFFSSFSFCSQEAQLPESLLLLPLRKVFFPSLPFSLAPCPSPPPILIPRHYIQQM